MGCRSLVSRFKNLWSSNPQTHKVMLSRMINRVNLLWHTSDCACIRSRPLQWRWKRKLFLNEGHRVLTKQLQTILVKLNKWSWWQQTLRHISGSISRPFKRKTRHLIHSYGDLWYSTNLNWLQQLFQILQNSKEWGQRKNITENCSGCHDDTLDLSAGTKFFDKT